MSRAQRPRRRDGADPGRVETGTAQRRGVDVGGMGENRRVKRRFHLTFPERLAGEPMVFTAGKRFGVVPNIRRASIEEGSAWIILELEGEEEDIAAAVSWLSEQGVTVDRMDEDEG